MARTTLRTTTAAVAALGLGLLAMSPASAAGGYQAGATAAAVFVAGNGNDTGVVTASNDGSGETKTGNASPALSVLKNQALLNAGVLTQQATASPTSSAACAGFAGGGGGGSVVDVGDSSCLTGDGTVNLTLGATDLSKVVLADPASPLSALNDVQKQLLVTTGVQDAVTSGINQVFSALRDQFGNIGVDATLGAIDGRCTADSSGAKGDADILNTKVVAHLPQGKDVVLLDLPVHPDPNTHLTTDLSKVLDMVLAAVDTDLQNSLDGSLAPLQQVTSAIRDNIVKNIHDQVEKNLAPLEANLLDVTLNQQTPFPAKDSIKVRALDLKVLPAAEAQLKAPAAELQIGDAACAPVAAAAVDAPQAATPVVSPPKAATPTGVSSGLATMPGSNNHGIDTSTWALLALAGLGLAGSAWVGVRRVLG